MANLWGMIAKARGLELGDEFLYSWGSFTINLRISEVGLDIYEDGQWYSSIRSNAFIRGEGKIEKIPFAPKVGESYWTYYNSRDIYIGTYCWSNNYFDK